MPDSLSSQSKWMLYPVRSEQIKAAGSDDTDHAEWVIRADGPLPGHPVQVVPAEEAYSLDEQNVMQQSYLRNIITASSLKQAQMYAREAIERSR